MIQHGARRERGARAASAIRIQRDVSGLRCVAGGCCQLGLVAGNGFRRESKPTKSPKLRSRSHGEGAAAEVRFGPRIP